MSKYYKADDVIRAIEEMQNCYNGWSDTFDKAQIIGVIEELVPIEVSEEELKGSDKVDKRFSKDAISREDLGDKVGRYYAERGDFGSLECSWILDAIKNAPSVIPKPKEGEWIKLPHKVYLPRDCEPEWTDPTYDEKDHSVVKWRWHCKVCGVEASRDTKPTHNFCPNCGAKMKGADNEA